MQRGRFAFGKVILGGKYLDYLDIPGAGGLMFLGLEHGAHRFLVVAFGLNAVGDTT